MGSRAGVLKAAAARLGVPFDEYLARLDRGERWCFACSDWHDRSAFSVDRSRGDGLAMACRDSRNRRYRDLYEPVPEHERKPHGPPPELPRDGDADQARHRINVLVRTGRLPRPDDLPCVDCGHVRTPGERRHEYDHHRGYAAEHHLDVEPVCTSCHHRRENDRAAAVA